MYRMRIDGHVYWPPDGTACIMNSIRNCIGLCLHMVSNNVFVAPLDTTLIHVHNEYKTASINTKPESCLLGPGCIQVMYQAILQRYKSDTHIFEYRQKSDPIPAGKRPPMGRSQNPCLGIVEDTLSGSSGEAAIKCRTITGCGAAL